MPAEGRKWCDALFQDDGNALKRFIFFGLIVLWLPALYSCVQSQGSAQLRINLGLAEDESTLSGICEQYCAGAISATVYEFWSDEVGLPTIPQQQDCASDLRFDLSIRADVAVEVLFQVAVAGDSIIPDVILEGVTERITLSPGESRSVSVTFESVNPPEIIEVMPDPALPGVDTAWVLSGTGLIPAEGLSEVTLDDLPLDAEEDAETGTLTIPLSESTAGTRLSVRRCGVRSEMASVRLVDSELSLRHVPHVGGAASTLVGLAAFSHEDSLLLALEDADGQGGALRRVSSSCQSDVSAAVDITLDARPVAIAMTADDLAAYVVVTGADGSGWIERWQLPTAVAPDMELPLPGGDTPEAIVLADDRPFVLVQRDGEGQVQALVDAAWEMVTLDDATLTGARSMVAVESSVFVAASGWLYHVDAEEHRVTASFALNCAAPSRVIYSAHSGWLAVACDDVESPAALLYDTDALQNGAFAEIDFDALGHLNGLSFDAVGDTLWALDVTTSRVMGASVSAAADVRLWGPLMLEGVVTETPMMRFPMDHRFVFGGLVPGSATVWAAYRGLGLCADTTGEAR